MKAIQITIDEALLRQLDADAETQKRGRSAVIRAALRSRLRARRTAAIDEAYRRGYGSEAGLGAEFGGWEDQGVWLDP